MQELIPHYSCIVNPGEFKQALEKGYTEVYINSPTGPLKHLKLKGDRYVRLKVDSLPSVNGVKVIQENIEEEINFLPAGKIPFDYFKQIVTFFREVVKLKKAEFEAHAWIIWREDFGYKVSIPKQTVSKASVQFVYDDDALPKGSIIVVDIHSHNTMGAFYSGTDNNNDKSGVYYSGVIGKLTDNSYESVFRFNLYDIKKECKLLDIFDVPEKPKMEIPAEWLEKVEVKQMMAPLGRYVPNGTPIAWEHHLQTEKPARKTMWEEMQERRAILQERASFLNQEDEEEKEEGNEVDITMDPNSGNIEVKDGMDEIDFNHSDEYSYYCTQYGKDAADSKESIELELGGLEDCDEGLLDLIRTMYQMLSESGKSELAQNGM